MRLLPVGLRIRPMIDTDYHSVFMLYRQLIGRRIYCERQFAKIFKSFFDSEEREAFVAEAHNRVIGFVTIYYLDVFHHCGPVASIQELVVTEEFRGRGVGKTLVEFVKQQMREKSCHGLEVATDLWQSGAKSFYEKCGLEGRTCMAAN